MIDDIAGILAVFLFLLLIVLGCTWGVLRFHECRAHGFSTMYCLGQ